MFTMSVPANITNNKECKLHTICLKSAKILAWHTYLSHTGRLGKEGTNKGACFSLLLSPAGKERKKEAPDFPSSRSCIKRLWECSLSYEFFLLFSSYWIFLLKYTKLHRTRIDENTIFCGKQKRRFMLIVSFLRTPFNALV